MFLWVKPPCGSVGTNQRFGEACFFHLPNSNDDTEQLTKHPV